jgi:IS4 transposase
MLFNQLLEHLIKRAPLPMMARLLLERSLDADRINALFAAIATEQYTRVLLFSDIVALMCMVVSRMHRSVKAAYDTYKEVLPKLSATSIYNKLNRIEPATMSALIQDNAVQLGAVIDELKAGLPALIPGFSTRIVDGNAIAATDRRLKKLRDVEKAPLPGKSIVVFDYERDLAMETIPCEDGHAQERSLFRKLLDLIKSGEVWIADRNFCTKAFLEGIVERGGHFLIRQHAKLRVIALNELVLVGSCENGEVFEQSVRIGTDPSGLIVRRIEIRLSVPTRDGDFTVGILTSLPKEVLNGVQVSETYRKRWRIETAFRDLTLALRCEIKGLGTPRAALFVFTVALLAANILATIRAAIRAAHGSEIAANVSTYGLVNDLEGTFRATELFSQSESELPGSRNVATVQSEVQKTSLENRAETEESRSTEHSAPSDVHAEIVATRKIEQGILASNASATSRTQTKNQSAPFGINWQDVSLIPLVEFVTLLLRCAKNLKLQRYPKAKPRKRNLQQKRTSKKKQQHVSTYRILNPQEAT